MYTDVNDLDFAQRTPDNLYPFESQLNPASGWDCTNFHQMLYGGGTAQVYHETDVPSWHPFLPQFWNGTCDEGQLTAEGLTDAVKHGKVSLLKTFQKNAS